MRLTADFETRSAADLKKVGAWAYSEHPSTDVLCLGYKFEGESARIVTPSDENAKLVARELIHAPTEIHGHNVFFEYCIWEHVCAPKYGWPRLPVDKLRDTAAQAAMHALPRKLEAAGAALGLPIQKSKEGVRLINKLCKPRRARKGEVVAGQEDMFGFESTNHGLLWNEDPADMAALFEYCKRDCEAEECLSNALRPLPPAELALWQLDQTINRRGIPVDLVAARAMVEFIAQHEARLLERLRDLTGGKVRTGRQTSAMMSFLEGLGVSLPNMQAATVKAVLSRPGVEEEEDDWEDEEEPEEEEGAPLDVGPLPPLAREILEIRRSLAQSAGAKYEAMLRCAGKDGRIHGAGIYHGASTGRWAGALIQHQNFKKPKGKPAEMEQMLETIKAGGLELFEALYDEDPMSAAGSLARSAICAGGDE